MQCNTVATNRAPNVASIMVGVRSIRESIPVVLLPHKVQTTRDEISWVNKPNRRQFHIMP